MEPTFEPDEEIDGIAKSCAVDALELAEANFGVKLNWSEKSIQQVEKMLGELHKAMDDEEPDEETVWIFAQAFGSYLGEVFIKSRGGKWGLVKTDEDEFPGIEAEDGTVFWPWARVLNRITDGPDDNVWQYYQELADEEE